jgi:hypothetical protein
LFILNRWLNYVSIYAQLGHMKNKEYPGVVMIFEGIDGEMNVYPIAVALVDVENLENYLWFLNNLLKHDLLKNELSSPSRVLFSDRDKGLLNAVAQKLKVLHRLCIKHLERNIKTSKT